MFLERIMKLVQQQSGGFHWDVAVVRERFLSHSSKGGSSLWLNLRRAQAPDQQLLLESSTGSSNKAAAAAASVETWPRSRRRLCFRRVCYAMVLAAALVVIATVSTQSVSESSLNPKQQLSLRPGLLLAPSSSYLLQQRVLESSSWSLQTVEGSGVGGEEEAADLPFIEEVITFTSEVLFLVRVPAGAQIPSKERMACRYGPTNNNQSSPSVVYYYRKARSVQLDSSSSGRAFVVCRAPPKKLHWGIHTASIEVDKQKKKKEIRSRSRLNPSYKTRPVRWNFTELVYDVFPTEKDILVLARGLNISCCSSSNPAAGSELSGTAAADSQSSTDLKCVFGGFYQTSVTAAAQEVFRCLHPPASMAPFLSGKKITLMAENKLLPSLAHYHYTPPGGGSSSNRSSTSIMKSLARKIREALSTDTTTTVALSGGGGSNSVAVTGTKKQHHICSCTMVYNGAKFLKEWVMYHSHLGVEKFFLYDNNSEDELEDVVTSLQQHGFEISRKVWPWFKTQEAGFSHCAMQTEPECTWMLFSDLDEFVHLPPTSPLLLPNAVIRSQTPNTEEESMSLDDQQEQLPALRVPTSRAQIILPEQKMAGYGRTTPSALAVFIAAAINLPAAKLELENTIVGQIQIPCYNFGPSGLLVSSKHGVTQGYTCRTKFVERHKSLVLLGSTVESLQNVIHHFSLKPGFRTNTATTRMAVINHYKFQVWDEFKTKFQRRAATYVADWTEDRNHASKDRVPDLGIRPVKPPNWETSFCEEQDFALRDYAHQVFGSLDGSQMAWSC